MLTSQSLIVVELYHEIIKKTLDVTKKRKNCGGDPRLKVPPIYKVFGTGLDGKILYDQEFLTF